MAINLTEKEKIVLDVILDFLNKNRQFNMKKILPYIIARFRASKTNINKDGIEIILKSLIKKKIIYEGSKLNRKDLLNNSNRKMIYNHILNNPGTYFNNVVKNLGLSNHVVIWHLNMLCKFEYIQKETIENKNIYFSPHINPKAAKKIYLSSKEKSQKILNYLKSNNKGVTKTKLSLELKIHPYTLNRYLESLERLNLIIKKNSLKKILYFLNFDEQFSNF